MGHSVWSPKNDTTKDEHPNMSIDEPLAPRNFLEVVCKVLWCSSLHQSLLKGAGQCRHSRPQINKEVHRMIAHPSF